MLECIYYLILFYLIGFIVYFILRKCTHSKNSCHCNKCVNVLQNEIINEQEEQEEQVSNHRTCSCNLFKNCECGVDIPPYRLNRIQ